MLPCEFRHFDNGTVFFPKIESEDDGQQPKLPKFYILNLPSPCPQVHSYLENLGDVANDASLTSSAR